MTQRPARAPGHVPLAIIGAACRLPGAPDLAAYWRLLAEGRDAVGSVPPDRFDQAQFLHPRSGEPGKTYTFAAGTLGDVAGFEPTAFGISPREAAEMDPQQRLILELAAEAMEDAGVLPASLAASRTGVFIGASLTDYVDLRYGDLASGDRYFMTGGALSIIANRLGNVFDLRGPAQTIDTACSSSLVALHWAATALATGSIPAAFVGGVNMLLSPFPFLGFARAGMLSPSGRCHAFDARADGYVRAEGGAVILLKRLADAEAAGDPIRGVILATGSNAAGRTMGLSLPSSPAQQALIERVMAEAGATPADFCFFEAHGTGTAIGDPLEASAIGRAIGCHRTGRPLPIGSAKANIGHTEPASGMAGLLKAMLVLEHQAVPGHPHFVTPNPHIDFAGLGLAVPTALTPLAPEAGRLAGVNSFGFGGTNACAVLAPPPRLPRRKRTPDAGPLPPLLLSARSAEGLRALAAAWAPRLAATPRTALPALLRGAARHRQALPFRLALRGQDGPALAAALPEAAAGPVIAAPGGEGVGFVFAGNGAPWAGMAQHLARLNPAFAAALAEADAALAPYLGWSPADRLAAGVTAGELAATEQAQPLLFTVQHAIVGALAAEGIRPAFTLGHSVGEIAAALAAGLLPLPEAARLIVARSRRQAETRGIGRMAALGCGEAEAAEALVEAGPGLEIAAINAPDALTIAGPAAALERLATLAAERRWSFVPLDLDYAFHSAAMDPLHAGLLDDLAGLAPTAPRVPMISTVTGAPLDAAEAGPGYWWRNLREPVRFAAGLAAAAQRQPRLLIEIGPHPVLQSYIRTGLRAVGSEAAILPSLSRRDPPGDPFPALADRAWTLGADPREGPAFVGPAVRGGLPTTPFHRTPHWFARTVEATPIANRRVDHPLLGARIDREPGRWVQHLDVQNAPWLADHALGGQPVLPAAAMLEMALAAGAVRHPEAAALELSEMALLAVLPLGTDRPREIVSQLDAEGGFTLRSRPRLSDEPWTLHATGRVGPLAALPPLPEAPAMPGARTSGAAIRALAARAGLQYGPAFAAVTEAAIDPALGQAVVSLEAPATAPPDADFLLHPSRFDGALQGLVGLLADQTLEAGAGILPVRVARLVLRRHAGAAAQAALRLTARGERSAAADLVLRDAAGLPVALAWGCGFQRIRLPGSHDPAEAAFRVELIPAEPLPGSDAPAAPALAAARTAAATRDAALDLGDIALLLEGVCTTAAHQALAGQEAAGPYARALLGELANGGLAEPGPGGLRPVPAPDLPPPVEVWRQVLLEQPALAQELAWVALATERLAAALAGSLPAETVPEGPPAQGAAQARLAEVLAAAAAIAAAWPAGRPLRVLEVGAGPGPLTACLIAALAGPGRRILYRAAALPGRPLPAPPPALAGLVFESLSWDPFGSEAPPPAADLVIGLGASARFRAGAALPAALLPACAPGAALLLAEPAPGQVWDFCCGQDPAWWSGPGGAAPLAAAEAWQAALAAADWGDASVQPLLAAPWPAVLIVARAPATAAVLPAPKLRRVLLLADPGMAALLTGLAAALQARGATVTPGDLLSDAPRLAPRQLEGQLVVALAAGGATPEALAATLAALARLAAAAEGSAAGFRLVTQGGQQPPTSRQHDPAGAACFALGRVLANEHPALKPRRIDLCPSLGPEAAARRLALSLLAEASPEAEITLTPEAALVPRLRPGLPAPGLPAGRLGLTIRRPGQLDTLLWAPIALPNPGPGEVLIRIEAAGLNFRDVMWAQGLLPEEVLQAGFAGPGLGMECAGIVEAIGADVALRPGDRVFGVAPRALATHAITRAEALALRPDGLDPLAAASVPVAFLTAVHALEELARLEDGERVLVHGGAGAVGLAALQVARARGARVAATAGTPAKRAFLRAAGAEIVLDSRDAGFADQLQAAWGRAGEPGCVDVVLNSLAGEAMERSLALLAPFGRFLELGKRDFVENRRVALRPLRRNATFFAVDVDELPRARPAAAARLLAGIAKRLAAGIFRPLPTAGFAANSAEAAFRTLQASGHIGKLVLRPPAMIEGQAPAPVLARARRGTVLVIGGTQGFGLAAARWLAERGVQRLVLLSRRGMATPGAEAALRDLAARGANASMIACDAADPQALAEALQALRASHPPLRGVVHAAAIAADGAAATLDPQRIAAVLAAKLRVAENLDRLTAEDPLALFLLFGSATVPVGNPGQAAYVAANAALDALARRRQAEGKPATCIAWGPIADAGMLADAAQTAEVLRRRLGATPLPAEQALAALPALLESGLANAGLARVAWGEARAALAVLGEPAFAAVRDAAGIEEGDLRERLRALPPAEALALLKETLAAELGRILRLPGGAVPLDAPLAGLGLDSLGGMELRVGLEQRLGMAVPLTSVSETLTLESLAHKLAQQLHGGSGDAAIPADALALAAAHEPEAPADGVERAA